MTHHRNEHVREDDDDGYVVEGEQEQTDPLDDGRRVIAAGEAVRELVSLVLVGVLDFRTLHPDQAEHRPEQAEQCPRHAARVKCV